MKNSKGKLDGKRVVITGVSRGVGLEVARLFLVEGAQVLGVARNRNNLARADRELSLFGKNYSSVLADVASPATGAKIRKAASRRWSAIDILINNAGVGLNPGSFADEPDGTLEKTFAINVLGPYRITRALLPLLKKGRRPRVMNVSSGAGSLHSISTGATMASYRFSKWALNGLTMLFANALAGKVSVIAMDPGWVKTDMAGPSAPDYPSLSAERALAIALAPVKITGRFMIGNKLGGW